MDDLAPLSIVCRHLRSETRDETVTRHRKGKRAAQTAKCRLQAKLRRAEMNAALLLAAYLTTLRQYNELHERVGLFVREPEPLSD